MKDKLADAGAFVGWGAWFMSHITQINQVLQALMLIAAIIGSLAAAWYHWKKARKL